MIVIVRDKNDKPPVTPSPPNTFGLDLLHGLG